VSFGNYKENKSGHKSSVHEIQYTRKFPEVSRCHCCSSRRGVEKKDLKDLLPDSVELSNTGSADKEVDLRTPGK
jgi:hypothetical protein